MRYWVYINDKVEGPFTEDRLVMLEGFTPDTLICSEDTANSGNQAWVKASTVFEFDETDVTSGDPEAAARAEAVQEHAEALTTMLLSKIDALTAQLSGMQEKLDGMKAKLDESISTQQKAAEDAAARADAIVAQVHNISSQYADPTLTRTSFSGFPGSGPSTQTVDLSTDRNKPLDMLEGIDLGPVETTPAENTTTVAEQTTAPLVTKQEGTVPVVDLSLPSDQPVPLAEQPQEENQLQPDKPEHEVGSTDITDDLLDKGDDGLALSSAVDALRANRMQGPNRVQSQEENETTFQDLLTPQQAEQLAQDAPEFLKKDSQKTQEQPLPADDKDAETKREEVLAEFSAAPAGDNAVEQLIKEKQAESEGEEKQSVTMRWVAAAASLVGLKKKFSKEDTEVPAQPAEEPAAESQPAEAVEPQAQPEEAAAPAAEVTAAEPEVPAETVEQTQEPAAEEQPQEQAAAEEQPQPEEPAEQEAPQALTEAFQPVVEEINVDTPADESAAPQALTEAAIQMEEPEQVQPAAEQEAAQPKPVHEIEEINLETAPVPNMEQPEAAETPARQEEPVAEQPAEAPVLEEQPEPVAQEPAGPALEDLSAVPESAPVQEEAPAPQPTDAEPMAIPSLGEEYKPQAQEEQKEDEEAPQELVPNAKVEEPSGGVITDLDLQEAFTERASQGDDPSVEQLFGLASAQGAVTTQPPAEGSDEIEEKDMPTSSEIFTPFSDDMTAVGNPNDLTEIELKEGATYLISDFVPPATSADSVQVPTSDNTVVVDTNQDASKKEEVLEVQDIVNNTSSDNQAQEAAAGNKEIELAEEDPEISVSKVILEQTIRAKRGANLDIKTVPMVPEPAQAERLAVDMGDDDINTQHDMKEADIEPASKNARLIVASVFMLILLSVVYIVLAWMRVIPAKLNVFPAKATVTQQAEEEMLGLDDGTPVESPRPSVLGAGTDPMLAEVQRYVLANGQTLKAFIEAEHAPVASAITWEISPAVDPDNYSVLAKVPPDNPQSFKTPYRFNYNAVSKELVPTTSDAKNLLAKAVAVKPAGKTTK